MGCRCVWSSSLVRAATWRWTVAVTWVPDGQSLKQNIVGCADSRTEPLHSRRPGFLQWASEEVGR